ncbi:MAG: hypothetical protein NWE93_07100 [Candidatus Bathyarchaeota archaeon]|nr:hypothetical protein [Candidatus Bathyarchaeota archaeon]
MPKPNRKALIAASAILAVIVVSAAILSISYHTDKPPKTFYVGVEVAYGDIEDLTSLVDEVKNYTNLVVLGLPGVSINRTLLDMSCNYIAAADLHFVVLFTNLTQYSSWQNTTPAEWVADAKQRYGDKFLAVYRWDEAGGDQIDRSRYMEVRSAESHAEAAQKYVDVLAPEIQYYQAEGQKVLTADYGLYWFDYRAGYDVVLAELGWNSSREQQIALVRGAARAHDKDWGAMITWTYSQEPYIASGAEVYEDLVLAYDSGARYAVVFSYPQTDKHGILGQEHLDTLKDFWSYIASHPQADYAAVKTAYVLPADYGFGFRSSNDTVWGLWSGDSQSRQIYGEVEALIMQFGADFDILCDYPSLMADAHGRYGTVIYWNGTHLAP